jgi:hypothetical protein
MPLDKRVDIFGLLRQEGKLSKVLVYPAKKTEIDPTEKTQSLEFLNPITIEALVRDLSPESLHWKYFGLLNVGSKELICQKKYRNLLELASKIQIGENYYSVRTDDSQGWNILERQDYIVCVLAIKNL